MGWFGKFELEGMALGKPVICYVSDELYEKYRPPVFRTTKDTFKQDLEYLLEDEATRHQLAKEGREYIRHIHSPKDTIRKIMEGYHIIQNGSTFATE
jgi:glycosyltransferase involved in cell wall biosynthesis